MQVHGHAAHEDVLDLRALQGSDDVEEHGEVHRERIAAEVAARGRGSSPRAKRVSGEARLRRAWRDGTRAIVFEPLAFLERLAALVLRPRAHLLMYHGVLAPAAQWRDRIVPGPRTRAESHHGSAERGGHPLGVPSMTMT